MVLPEGWNVSKHLRGGKGSHVVHLTKRLPGHKFSWISVLYLGEAQIAKCVLRPSLPPPGYKGPMFTAENQRQVAMYSALQETIAWQTGLEPSQVTLGISKEDFVTGADAKTVFFALQQSVMTTFCDYLEIASGQIAIPVVSAPIVLSFHRH